MVRRQQLAAGLLLALVSGCSSNVTQNATALLVVVEADPQVREHATRINVTIRRRVAGTFGAPVSTDHFEPGADGWPFTFVVQAQDPTADIEVYAEVIGVPGSSPISVSRALTSYSARRTLVLPLMFWSGCTPTRCSVLQTCARPTGDGLVTVDDCGSAIQSLPIYTAASVVGSCGAMQYRYGTECRMFPLPPGDGGTGDVPRVDAPPGSDVPSDIGGDLPTDIPMDAARDAGVDGVTADVPVDLGVDTGPVTVDVPVVCPTTPMQCDGGGMIGLEVTDTNNCGGCGLACPVHENTAATCQRCACIYPCTSGFGDCDHEARNGCEVGVNSDPANCGSCGSRCPMLPDGGAPVCIDGHCVL